MSKSEGSQPESDNGSEPEPAEPLNREQRRAQRRGKQPPPAQPGGYGPPRGNRDRVVVPRRSGRRGNR